MKNDFLLEKKIENIMNKLDAKKWVFIRSTLPVPRPKTAKAALRPFFEC